MRSDASRTGRFSRSRRALGVSLLFALGAIGEGLGAQVTQPAPQPTVVLRGTVFDSLSMTPVAKATVWIPGGSQTTTADDNGRFELDNVPVGMHFIAFSSPALDSLGLGTLGSRVEVPRSNARVQLSTPPFRTLWRALCYFSELATKDSGIVWGTIRDANTDARLSGAAVSFSWYDLNSKMEFREELHRTRSDSTGTFYACGLPTDIKVLTEAAGTRSASGAIEYLIGTRRVLRMDMLVSTDMVLQKEADSSGIAGMRAKGTSRLRGRVVDYKGNDVADAVVTIASLDTTVRTNAQGEFTMLNLPAGSHGLQVRKVGLTPATMMIELRPGEMTQIKMSMANPQTLETVNVKAAVRAMGADQVAFLQRQKLGMGYTLGAEQLQHLPQITTALQLMPSISVSRSRGSVSYSMNNRRGGQCQPTLYLDKSRVTADQIDVFAPQDFIAIEVYNSTFTVPIGFPSQNGCGVILFWTKRAFAR